MNSKENNKEFILAKKALEKMISGLNETGFSGRSTLWALMMGVAYLALVVDVPHEELLADFKKILENVALSEKEV